MQPSSSPCQPPASQARLAAQARQQPWRRPWPEVRSVSRARKKGVGGTPLMHSFLTTYFTWEWSIGEFVFRELQALVELHKYRAMKNRYAEP